MQRIYELTFILDPRLSDEEANTIADEYDKMVTDGGGQVLKRESWGRRKLAYPINKLNEGRYMLFYVGVDGGNPLPGVELRLNQNDKVLRFLTVRTDREVDLEPPVEAEAETASEQEG